MTDSQISSFCATDSKSLIECFPAPSLLQQAIGLREDSRQRGLQEEEGKLSVVSFLWEFYLSIHGLSQCFNQLIKDLDIWSYHKSEV